MVSGLIDNLICKPLFCDHPKPIDWPCEIAKAIVSTIAGCIGGKVKNSEVMDEVDGWVISLIGKAGGSIGKSACQLAEAW